ncbi:hypothetical protein N431DRAFT_404413 [Stipitochalara longipes BDJ]|nr:hypothetical protein N431DRAFT_404413 [Stipitochalara longipes BDJ]
MASISGSITMPNFGSESGSPGKSTSRIRSRVACRGCNQRKVRCDVTRTGNPCSNCRHDAATCEVLPRKKHRPRRPRTVPQSSPLIAPPDYRSRESIPSPKTSATRPFDLPENQGGDYVDHRLGSLANRQSSVPENAFGSREPENSSTPFPPIDAEEVLPDDSSLTYIAGDRRGPRFFVYDICHPESPQDARPHLVPRPADTSWKPHEVEYLRHQGAFDTLPNSVCDDLIRCYFHHVHFFLPIVDVASFLNEYENNGRQNISLLLYWSMLLAAANFVEPDVLRKSGFESRKAMKTAFYERAKCLYDLDHGTDKLVLIQSVILMGFWYTDPQDHTGAWYWIGIAITLSQALGLHRCPQGNNRNQRFSEVQQPLIRRIWWSCLVRDRWLSLAKGRPMRIHHDDCDVPLPRDEDIINNLETIPLDTKNKFIPIDSKALAGMWINLVEISSSLGKILRVHYRVSGLKPTIEDINASSEELRSHKPREAHRDSASELLLLHGYHVELFYEATVAVLYRPYVLSGPLLVPSDAHSSWQKTALDQARTAASNTNTVLEKIIELNLIHLLKPMMITSFIPAMQIHLFDCKSSVPIRRGLGKNKLNLCMLVLAQLRNTYWSASVIYRLFERAQIMLDKAKSTSESSTEGDAGNITQQTRTYSRSKEHGTAYKLQQSQQDMQYGHEFNRPTEAIPESTLQLDNHNVSSAFWLNESGSPCFSNVDHLLSPGFYVPENVFQPFFGGYENGNGIVDSFDQYSIPMSL